MYYAILQGFDVVVSKNKRKINRWLKRTNNVAVKKGWEKVQTFANPELFEEQFGCRVIEALDYGCRIAPNGRVSYYY
jgi:hypothetical protein